MDKGCGCRKLDLACALGLRVPGWVVDLRVSVRPGAVHDSEPDQLRCRVDAIHTRMSLHAQIRPARILATGLGKSGSVRLS